MRRTLVLVLAGLAALMATAVPAGAHERPEHRREPLRLRCAWVTEGEQQAVACRWSESRHPRFAEYRLVRADRANGRSVVFSTEDRTVTRFLDTTAVAGTRYVYRVVVLDADGHLIGGSRLVPARAPVAA